MRTFLVSDIHGHYFTFQEALSQVGFEPGRDCLVVIGDVMDRGLNSKECLLYIYQLQQSYPKHSYLIKGNHEQMFELWLTDKIQSDIFINNGGLATIRSFLAPSELRKSFLRGVPEQLVQNEARREILSRYPFLLPYLQSLPLYMEEPDPTDADGPPAIFVHAGIRPGIPLQKQKPDDLLWIREDFWGHYKGDAMIVFGHTMVRRLPGYVGSGPWRSGNMIGIDGGAASYDGGILLVEWPTIKWVYVPNQNVESAPVIHMNKPKVKKV